MQKLLLVSAIVYSIFKYVHPCGGGGGGCSPRSCEVSYWSGWSQCDKSCGGGTRVRTRSISRREECGGSQCPSNLRENDGCNRQCCPVDCQFTYGAWSACSGCGTNGQQTRSITISKHSSCNGKACPSSLTEQRTCNTGRCCPVNCITSSWGAWSSCNAACDKMGQQLRRRSITRNPSCNGGSCGSLTMTKSCAGPCCPKDCVYATWTSWTKCNAPLGVCTVNSGTQSRSRRLVKTAVCNGKCGSSRVSQRCTPQSITCQLNNWGSWLSCRPTSGNCGSGTRARSRTIRRQPVCSRACDQLKETQTCLHSCCPVPCVYNQWGQWGSCSNQCGRGITRRTRTIKSRESCNGLRCDQSQMVATQSCTKFYNVDCRLSVWSAWSTCNNGCGTGTTTRTRTVTVVKRCNGRACGSLRESKSCQSFRNNRDCAVTSWSLYGACTEKCAIGVRYRTRVVSSPTVCKGKQCPSLTSSVTCGTANGGCDQNCNKGICSCRAGYNLVGVARCQAKNCGAPRLKYCPSGEKQRGVCIYPTINCPSARTTYPVQCPLACPIGYTLTGESKLSCQTTGIWKTIQSYCKRNNKPPTNIMLSGDSTVAENTAAPFNIGQLTTTDLNANDSHTYKIVRDPCNCFSIAGNKLRALKAFDFEAQKNTFQLDIKTTDNGIPHLSYTKRLTIRVTDVNEKPTDIIMLNGFVKENTDIGVVVGTLQTVDTDRNQSHTYRVIGGDGLFKIQGNQLITAKSNKDCLTGNIPNTCPLNYEKSTSHTVILNAMDSGNPPLDVDKQLKINVRNVNDAPYRLQLSSSDIRENAPKDTLVGTLSATDEDKTQKLNYTLVDDDEGGFYVDSSSGKLFKSKPSDYESTNAHSIVVQVQDNGSPSKSTQSNFTINVIDVNEPPVQVILQTTTATTMMHQVDNQTLYVAENTSVDTMLATVQVYDRDVINSLQISLDDTSGGAFTIKQTTAQCSRITGTNSNASSVCSANVYLSKALNYEALQNYNIDVRVIDRRHSALRHFKFNVTDCNDSPSQIKIQNAKQVSVMENQKGINVGQLSTDDEDPNQVFQYRLLNELDSFEIFGQILKLKYYVLFDYETRTSYTVNISSTDSGSPAKSIDQQITVNVLDLNDAVKSVSLSRLNVSENHPIRDAIANITLVDEDNPTPNYETHPCQVNQPSIFYTLKNQLYTRGGLDYETNPTINLTLTCTDKILTSTWSFQINVIDVNEAPTKLEFPATNISESSVPPFYIGNFSCIDPDQDKCTYQLKSLHLSKFLELRGSALYGISTFDHETQGVFDVDVQVSDERSPSLGFLGKVRFSVLDVNESPSDITLSNDVLDENSAQHTMVGYLGAIDQDRGQTHTFQLVDDAEGRFEIFNNTLRVSRISDTQCTKYGGNYCKLNFEITPQLVVTILTIDSGTPAMSLRKNFTVNLRDINDAPRDIVLSNYTVKENAVVGSLIGIFNAKDEDARQSLSFKLIGGPTAHFYVDGQSHLRVKTNFSDYETQTSYKLMVSVEDNGPTKLQTEDYVIVEVLNVNEPPISIVITDRNASQPFNDSNPRVAENTQSGTIVGYISSRDADFASSLVFKLDDDSNGTFVLSNQTTCRNVTSSNVKTTCDTLLLVGDKNINYELKRTHKIIVRATDQGGLFRVQEFTVVILDEDDRSTGLLINRYEYVTVTEGQRNTAYYLGTLYTVDEDAGQLFRYEMLDTDDGHKNNNRQLFEISGSKLMIKANAILDFESMSNHVINISVIDALNTIVLTDSIQVHVTDINEKPTDILLNNFNVVENCAAGTVVSNISVADPDNLGAANATKQSHSCSVVKGLTYFKVVAGNLLETKADNIDFEQKPTINVEIICVDSGVPTLSLTKAFTIRVEDLNERPINVSISSNYVIENSPPGIIGDLSTDDHDNFDGLLPQSFVYELLNQSSPFAIKNKTLFTTQSLDFEQQNMYTLLVKSTDDGVPPLSTQSFIQVHVKDINEAASNILLSQKSVLENAAKGTKIGDLTAIDEDRSKLGQKQQHTFELVENPKGLFRIAGERLEVALDCDTEDCRRYGGKQCLLNHEENGYKSIKIKVTDDGTPPKSSDHSFTISVEDRNEPPRKIQLSGRIVPENASIGYVIGRITFTDEDYGDNHTIYLPNDDDGRFSIGSQGDLVKAKATNYEKQSRHHITIGVKDSGSPPMNTTFDVSIYVEDVNESPTSLHITDKHGTNDFAMDRPLIDENLSVGSVVGTIMAFDQDTVTDLVFSLEDDAQGSFQLDDTVTCQNITQNETSHTQCNTKLLTKKMLNYENGHTRFVLVKVADHANLTHVVQFNISLVDKNDRPTNITVLGETMVLVEENKQDVSIGKLECIDEDNAQKHTYQLLDDAGQRFTIKPSKNGGHAVYTTSKVINYEESKNYDIIVMVTDNGYPPMSSRNTINIQILDVNEAPTAVMLNPSKIEENTVDGTWIGNITVVDPDNERDPNKQTHTCSARLQQLPFRLYNNMLFVSNCSQCKQLDYETSVRLTINTVCTDSGFPSKSRTEKLTIDLTDVNEPPTGLRLDNDKVSENAKDRHVGIFYGIDPDKGINQNLTYELLLGNNAFYLLGDKLLTKTKLDYEKNQTHEIKVKVSDYKGLSYVHDFNIIVEDENDAPTNLTCAGLFSIPETSLPGTIVGYCTAVDEDSAQRHRYEIVDIWAVGYNGTKLLSSPTQIFKVQVTTGRLEQVTLSLDHEHQMEYIVTLRTTDSGTPPLSFQKNVSIAITNVNQPPTDIVLDNSNITENSPVGSVIGHLSITDPDNKHKQIHGFNCSVKTLDGSQCPFTVNANNLTVAVAAMINFEYSSFFDVSVTCVERTVNKYPISRTFKVEIININEAPLAISLKPDNINELNAADAFVGVIQFVDPDNLIKKVDEVTLTNFNTFGAPFVIHPPFTINTTRQLDFEEASEYTVEVTLTDNGTPIQSTKQNLTIKVNDLNDFPANITLSTLLLPEDLKPGDKVATIVTVDEDVGQTHKYELLNDDGISFFNILKSELILKSTVKFKDTKTVKILMQSADNGKPPRHLQKVFEMTVVDKNNAPSKILSTIYAMPENTNDRFKVAELMIIDDDIGQSHTCTSTVDYVDSVTEANGNVTIYILGNKKSTDYEKSKSFVVNLTCKDNGTPVMSIDKPFTIPISNVNEAPSAILINNRPQISIPENTISGYFIGNLSCTDPDEDQAFNYTLLQTSTEFFEVIGYQLFVRNLSLDFESTPSQVVLNVMVNDQGGLSSTAKIPVLSTDVNEAPGNIRFSAHPVTVPENATIDSNIGEIVADDPELGKQTIKFTLETYRDMFEIIQQPSSKSFLQLKKSLDYDTLRQVNISIKVQDSGTPPLSSTGTIYFTVLRSDRCITHDMQCQQHASCTRMSKTSVRCRCDPGFKQDENDATKCAPIDDCEDSCDNCLDLTVKSKCKDGDASVCVKCLNNGTCVDRHSNFTCNCVDGFKGYLCEINIDDCQNNPCKHGTCKDGINAFTCQCLNGYKGELCDEEINECKAVKTPCYKSECIDLIDSYKCTCLDKFSGVYCERQQCSADQCEDGNVCHSVNLMLEEQNTPRCVPKEKLVTLTYGVDFAPRSGDAMYAWMYKFIRFLTVDVKVPYSWLSVKSGNSKSVHLEDAVIQKYEATTVSADRVRKSTSEEEDEKQQTSNQTTVTFYGVIEESFVKSNILLYAIKETCEEYYSDCSVPNNQFKCNICSVVVQFIKTNADNKDFAPPEVLASRGSPNDPLWMDVLPIVGMVLCGLLLITIGFCIYRKKRNQYRFKRDNFESEEEAKNGTSLSVLEERSKTWNEHDLAQFSGQTNPIYGLYEDEVESPVVGEVSYRKKNPDTAHSSAEDVSGEHRDSRMFDNPLYGLSPDSLTNDDTATNHDDPELRDHSAGFFNPTFQSEDPESEL